MKQNGERAFERSAAREASQESLFLADRLALRPKEAAEALGIGERTLRQILPELPHVRVGGAVLLPVDGLREWLRERSEAELNRADRIAGEIMDSLSESR